MFLHRSFGKVPQAIDIVCANGDGGEAYLQIVEHVFHRELVVSSDRLLIGRSPMTAAQLAMQGIARCA
jgi:hypothetical protein